MTVRLHQIGGQNHLDYFCIEFTIELQPFPILLSIPLLSWHFANQRTKFCYVTLYAIPKNIFVILRISYDQRNVSRDAVQGTIFSLLIHPKNECIHTSQPRAIIYINITTTLPCASYYMGKYDKIVLNIPERLWLIIWEDEDHVLTEYSQPILSFRCKQSYIMGIYTWY